MTQIVKSSLSLQDFLSLPETDITYELVDEEAIPKMAPKRFHSRITGQLYTILDEWNQNRGEVGIEWAVTLKRNGKDWCPVPDLLYISKQRLGDIPLADEACPVPPELVIEIISPEQSLSDLSEKAVDYLKAGVDRVWLIDTKAKKITIFSPNSPPQTKKGGDSLEDSILPNLTLTPEQLFQKAGLS
jgi:Uma2 family endonuclease